MNSQQFARAVGRVLAKNGVAIFAIKQAEAGESFAAEHGIAPESLSSIQKQLALLNAVLERGND